MDFKQRMKILSDNKKKWQDNFGRITDNSGIYILTRKDENGFRYAYIGQAKRILTRLAEHLNNYQHIDVSLKKYGLYNRTNPYGWNMACIECLESELDTWEKHFIKQYADKGYQLRNKTAGGQGEGKVKIDEYRPAKGYYDGIEQGKAKLLKTIQRLATRLKFDPINSNKISIRYYNEFMELIGGTDNVREADNTKPKGEWE